MIERLNILAFQWIHSGAGSHPLLDKMAIFFAQGGPVLMALLLAASWLLTTREAKLKLLAATQAAILGLGVNLLIGVFYYHPRPALLGLATPLFPHGPDTSFPSDHITLMFTAAFSLLIAGGPLVTGIVLLALTVLTGWARIYCGVHFPLDIAGSVAVGIFCSLVVRALANPLERCNGYLANGIDAILRKTRLIR